MALDLGLVRNFVDTMNGSRDALQLPSGPSGSGLILRIGQIASIDWTHNVALCTIGGGSIQVPVGILNQSAPPVGAFVAILIAGVSYVLLGQVDISDTTAGFVGAVQNDIPVGGLLGSKTNLAFNSTGTVFTLAVNVVAGHTYGVSLYGLGTQQTASSSITDFVLSVSAGTLSPGGFRAFSTAVNSGIEMSGTCHGLYTPASTGSVTFTTSIGVSAGTFQISAGNSLLSITRVT